MNKTELNEILKKHKMWLNNENGGECANLSGADLSGANFIGADLSDANLSGANLSGADLSDADLSGADLSDADLSDANLSGANLSGADLSDADLSGANFIGADLSDANLSGANLSGADLSDADLSGADLSDANLSGANLCDANLRRTDLSRATGMIQQWEFIKSNFESTADGIVAYKTFGGVYKSPEKWKIEKNSVITENVNFDRTNGCGCGINVATLSWVKENFNGEIWKVLIRWEWLAGVCVPYNSDGKIRCERCELLEVVKE